MSHQVNYYIPPEDQQFLSDLGFDVAGYLGEGCNGFVFNGVCNEYAKKVGNNEISLHGKSCAIKVFYYVSQWTDTLYNEAQTMMDLDHPNIVEIYMVCKSSKNIYIIMEYLNGGSLDSFLRELPLAKKVDEYTTLEMIRQWTAGLQYLHNQNKIHGDLHNDNIMLSVENNQLFCKLVDFGLTDTLESGNNMRDISDLGNHLMDVVNRSDIVTPQIEANLRLILEKMQNFRFASMNQVVEELSKNLPAKDPKAPTRRNSLLDSITKFFSKK